MRNYILFGHIRAILQAILEQLSVVARGRKQPGVIMRIVFEHEQNRITESIRVERIFAIVVTGVETEGQ